MQKLFLFFCLESTISILSLPFSTAYINKKSTTMHQMVFPFPFINCSIGKLVNSFTMMLIIFPFSIVNWSTSIMIHSMTFHFVLHPGSLIFFFSKSIRWISRNFENSLSMFHFDSIKKPPITFINCAVNILEFSISVKLMFGYFWLFLFWRLFDYLFLNLFFGTHFYNLSLLFFYKL